MNWDKSGSGSYRILEDNINKHVGSLEYFVPFQADSMQIQASDILEKTSGQRTRIFSIDGSHTAHATANDLSIAQNVVTPGGLILVDDYQNGGWPMVAEGVARFMILSPSVNIAPVISGCNKIVFTTISHHKVFLENFAKMPTSLPMTVRTFYGHDCLCY